MESRVYLLGRTGNSSLQTKSRKEKVRPKTGILMSLKNSKISTPVYATVHAQISCSREEYAKVVHFDVKPTLRLDGRIGCNEKGKGKRNDLI